MVHQKKRSDLPRCAHCGGVAVLCHGSESGNYWFACERFWEREAGYHTTTGFYPTEEEAVASWRRNVAHDVEKFKSPAGGVQSQVPRNGEAEAVANAVGRESVAQGRTRSNTAKQSSARPAPTAPTGTELRRESGTPCAKAIGTENGPNHCTHTARPAR